MDEQVRAKFRVVTRTETDFAFRIEAHPVHANDPAPFNYENDRYSRMSPGGKLELLTVNAQVAPYFKPGRTFYMGFDFDTPENRAAADAAACEKTQPGT